MGEEFGFAEVFDGFFRFFEFCCELGDAVWYFRGWCFECGGQAGHEGAFLAEVFEGVQAGVGFDAAGPGADGGFTQDGYGPDLGGVGDVGAAAEFHAEGAADFDDAHHVAVVFAEEGHCAHSFGFVQGGFDGVDLPVGVYCLVGDEFDVFQLFRGELFRVVEVEP